MDFIYFEREQYLTIKLICRMDFIYFEREQYLTIKLICRMALKQKQLQQNTQEIIKS